MGNGSLHSIPQVSNLIIFMSQLLPLLQLGVAQHLLCLSYQPLCHSMSLSASLPLCWASLLWCLGGNMTMHLHVHVHVALVGQVYQESV